MFNSHWLPVSIACQFVFTPKLASGWKMPPSFECRLTNSSLFPVLVSYFWIVIGSMYSLTFALPSGMSVWCLPYVVLCLLCDFILNTWANDTFLCEFDMPKVFLKKSVNIYSHLSCSYPKGWWFLKPIQRYLYFFSFNDNPYDHRPPAYKCIISMFCTMSMIIILFFIADYLSSNTHLKHILWKHSLLFLVYLEEIVK